MPGRRGIRSASLNTASRFGPDGRYGRWIRGHNAVVKIGSTLFVNGGISPKYAASSIAEMNARVRKELGEPDRLAGGMVVDLEGPLWYRGLARGTELAGHVSELLKTHGVERIVVARREACVRVSAGPSC